MALNKHKCHRSLRPVPAVSPQKFTHAARSKGFGPKGTSGFASESQMSALNPTPQISPLDHAQALAKSPDLVLVSGSVKGAMKVAGATARDLWYVPVEQIRVIPGFNVRFDGEALQAHVRWLADSMKLDGFKPEHPLSGYVARSGADSVIYLTDGHCRLNALKIAISEGAEIAQVPMVVSDRSMSVEDITVSLVSSATGKPLEPLEKAVVCKRLASFGWDDNEIARRLGMSVLYVRELRTLLGAPPMVRDLITQGKLSATAARDAIAQHGDAVVQKLTEGMAKAKATGRSRLTARFLEDKAPKVTTKQGVRLYDLVKQIHSNPMFARLSSDLRGQIEAVLNGIEKKRAPAAEPAPEQDQSVEQQRKESAPAESAAAQDSKKPRAPAQGTKDKAPRTAKAEVAPTSPSTPKDPKAPTSNRRSHQPAQADKTTAKVASKASPKASPQPPLNAVSADGKLSFEDTNAASTPADPALDLDGMDLDDFLHHPHWEALEPKLHEMVEQLPETAERCERTTLLSWIYLNQGVSTFIDLANRISGPESLTSRKRTLRRMLRGMEQYKLLSIVNFPDEEGEVVEDGEDLIGRNSMISITWTGMVWMRRAWTARAKLAGSSSVLIAHRTLSEEEDEGKAHGPVWVEGLASAEPDVVKKSIRAITSTRGHVTSVFDLGLSRQ